MSSTTGSSRRSQAEEDPMTDFFRLNPECYFVAGAKRGAIYNAFGGFYALDEKETEIIARCEKNEPVVPEWRSFLEEIKMKSLGQFYPHKVYVEKFHIGSPISEEQMGLPPKFYRAFIEINNQCNKDCWFCGDRNGNGKIHRTMGCLGCNVWKDEDETLSVEDWKNIVQQIRKLGCNTIYIKGYYNDDAEKIIQFAKNLFRQVYVISNANREVKIEDVICIKTLFPGEMPEDKSAIYLLIVEDEKGFERAKELKKEFKVAVDFVGDFENFRYSKEMLQHVTGAQLLHNFEFHPCLGGTIAVTSSGKVLPCPMFRGEVLGDLKNEKLYEIFRRGRIYDFWRMTMDEIERCKDCEFRYSCHDCRALEASLTKDLRGKRLCSYDPYEGR